MVGLRTEMWSKCEKFKKHDHMHTANSLQLSDVHLRNFTSSSTFVFGTGKQRRIKANLRDCNQVSLDVLCRLENIPSAESYRIAHPASEVYPSIHSASRGILSTRSILNCAYLLYLSFKSWVVFPSHHTESAWLMNH